MVSDTNSPENEEVKSEERQEKIEERMFDIAFRYKGKEYNGWGKASGKGSDGNIPASYHIVLNGVFFGNLSYDGEQWKSDRQREQALVKKVGEQIA